MEAIKKKMQALKEEAATAVEHAQEAESKLAVAEKKAEAAEKDRAELERQLKELEEKFNSAEDRGKEVCRVQSISFVLWYSLPKMDKQKRAAYGHCNDLTQQVGFSCRWLRDQLGALSFS